MLELARRFFRPYRRFLILGPLAKVIEVIFDLLTPLVIAWMIDAGIIQQDITVLYKGGALLLSFAVAGILFTLITQKMASVTSQGVGTAVRYSLFSHINLLSYTDLDALGTSGLLTRITNDTNQVQIGVAMLIRQVIRWPILAIGAIVCALVINVSLGLIFVVCLPLIALVFYIVMKRQVIFFSRMQKALDKIGQLVSENLQGVRVIRAFRREKFEEEQFFRTSREQTEAGTNASRLSAILNPATFLVINASICIILWIGAQEVSTGALLPGQIMAFIGYMNQLLISIAYVANLVVIFTRAEASAKRINAVLDWQPSISQEGIAEGSASSNSTEFPGHAGKAETSLLAFENVSYSYPHAHVPALSNITFQLRAGESLGIIGGTGSGKSTLANLIPRMLEAEEGRVLFNNKDVMTIPLRELHAHIGFVPQHASLLSGTLRENLTWRDTEASDQELWTSLEAAQARTFVEQKEDNLLTRIERDGRNVSGGQRQRLTIARALVGNPALIVLDDAASALDYATDAALRQSLEQLPTKPARILISQRIASVRNADKILVLDKGCIAGYGTHEELVNECPVYLEICKTQLREEEILS